MPVATGVVLAPAELAFDGALAGMAARRLSERIEKFCKAPEVPCDAKTGTENTLFPASSNVFFDFFSVGKEASVVGSSARRCLS